MRWLDRAVRVAAHLCAILSLAFASFLVLDYFNPLMGFTSNEVSTPLLALFCLTALVTALSRLAQPRAARHQPHARKDGFVRIDRGPRSDAEGRTL